MSPLDPRSLASPHLTEEELLRYCDGELPSKEATVARAHLEACWQCRTELDEIQKTVGECIRLRKAALGCYLPSPPAPWRDIRPKLEAADEELGRRPVMARLWSGMGAFLLAPFRSRLRWAPAAIALLAVVGVVHQLWRAPRVEAAELLRKAVAADRDAGAARPRRIQIRTASLRVTRVLHGRQAAAPELAAIEKAFAGAGYNFEDPLSARSYLDWHQQLASKQDEVAQESSTYTVRTRTDASELVDASLTLRESDLRAVEGSFRFRNHEPVEVTEIPGAPLEPGSESSPAAALLPPAALRRESDHPAAGAVAASATAGDELRVLAALHSIGADLGDPVEVARSGGSVLVTGVGIDAARRDEIARAIAGMPRVTARFHDAAAADATPMVRHTVRRAAVNEVVARLQRQLEVQVGGKPSFERFADQLLENGDDLMAHAHALRRLGERFPADVEGALDAADRMVLGNLRANHEAAIRVNLGAIHSSLMPALRGTGASAEAQQSASFGSWQAKAASLFEASRRMEALLAAVAGGASLNEPAMVENEKVLASRLMASVERLRAIDQGAGF